MFDSHHSFGGTDRFSIRRRLGAGGMGVVYEAFDLERGLPIAIKTLAELDAQNLYRFKNEFRALADLEHENLIRLGELFCHDGRWFFTMELIEGRDFVSFVRPGAPRAPSSANSSRHSADTVVSPVRNSALCVAGSRQPGAFDEERLRQSLRQLAVGLFALHAADRIHRDIKPSNILVTEQGRVVLLDFGLVTQASAVEGEQSSAQVVGTAHYMAPEQAAAKPLGPEADWYAVGCVLYEALTGHPPFMGSPIDVLLDKQRIQPPPPSKLVDGVPPDLDRLCTELLLFDSKARLSGRSVLTRLGVEESSIVGGPISLSLTQTPQFVGRQGELAALSEAFSDSAQKPVLLLVSGESGVGKSALVRRFLETLEHGQRRALVFSGRCYERESVPYNAFDGIIDGLSQHLARMDQVEAALVLGENAPLLSRLFPVLRRVPALTRMPDPSIAIPNAHELRTRAFGALRTTMLKISARRRIVLFIDDIQWADAASLELLNDVMQPADAPPMLVVGTFRSSNALTEPAIEVHGASDSLDVRRLRLEALPPDEAHELAEQLLKLHTTSAFNATAIAEGARGHPLFIQELVRHLGSADNVDNAAIRLEDMLRRRIEQLEAPALRLLEVVALAGGPVTKRVAAHAVALDLPEYSRWASFLRVANLIRVSGMRDVDTVEPYHDRIREAVVARLDEAARRTLHAKLADALQEAEGADADPQMLLRHLEGAGEGERAAKYAEHAAKAATETLAFERAAELYQVALRLRSRSPEDRRHLLLLLGEALGNAGRSADAAAAYVQAAEGADAFTRLDCNRRAAEHFLISGHLEPGLRTLGAVLQEVGVALPKSPTFALVRVLSSRLRVRITGLRWQPRDESHIAPHELRRLDVFKSVSLGLGMVDTLRGMSFHSRGLLLALQLGETRRIGRFIAHEAIYLSTEGRRRDRPVRKLVEKAEEIANTTHDPYLKAWSVAAAGTSNYLAGRFAMALEQVRQAENIFRPIAGTAWEVDSVRFFELFSLRHLGALRDLGRCYAEYVREAARRGDQYAETTITRVCNLVWLAQDRVEQGRQCMAATSWVPPTGTYHLQHWYLVRSHAEDGLYCDEGAPISDWQKNLQALASSLLVRVQTVRCESRWLHGRLILAQAHRDQRRERSLAFVTAIARKLEREGVEYAEAWGALLGAATAYLRGQATLAQALLRRAAELSDRSDMRLCATVARRRLGQLLGDAEGDKLVAQADEWMEREGIRDPARFSNVIAPGFPPAGESTIHSREAPGSSQL